ncbi:RagB/SusD family nutrient uptake outer membrane protein [Plebeiibacterium marinum]|uniref:RagB/SusD family nutrient uptake outer membrane protein n=1 Tax=Plebeiibacterium marinum TaxID=2992111 RepID=A0AAE3MHH7_9BACT|nr:RagB/SusD family nutrient uptake outer membrane protein [Plebeiobacterium marinum]MCW3807762.1 RagB/SusD family nutrient uptake outer membrane protein [Plebeiobacterium marinum]
MKKILNILTITVIGTALLFTACKDVLDPDNVDVLLDSEHYQDLNDANNGVLGVYALFQELAPQLVVLNELRGDLMDVTNNADFYLNEISKHQDVSADNPWADARPIYNVINNCNDVMANLKKMANVTITEDEYIQRYSDVGTLRSYLYLQLAMHFKDVRYIQTPIDDVEDLSKITDSNAPVLPIETMVDSLVSFMEGLPYVERYTDEELLAGSDGFSYQISFIDKEYFLGELYLWDGQYTRAATQFKNIMLRSEGDYDRYKIPTDFFNFSHYFSRYNRYYENDLESAVNNWPTMFSTYGSGDYYDEWIWVMYYHSTYEPSPLYDLFSIEKGSYLLKPSAKAMDLWGSQVQGNGFVGDFRGNIEDYNGNTGSYRMIGNDPVITKYISDYDPESPFELSGKWFLWRAAGLHLRYCEAANRDGKHKVAYSLMNNGIQPNYAYPGNKNDIYGDFNWEQTHEPAPYDFDARSTNANQVPPVHRGLWYRNVGVRGRVSLSNITVPADQDSLQYLENKILEEDALELAFEGSRWGDLVRVALRTGDYSVLADRVADKYEKAGDAGTAAAIRGRLMTRENWLLPLQ